MQPRVTVTLVMVWLTMAGLIGEAVTLRLSNNQRSSMISRRHAGIQQIQIRDWRNHDPADQPLDLWTGSRRSISAEGARRQHGPLAPTYHDPRDSPGEVRRKQQQETARRLEEKSWQWHEDEARKTVEDQWKKLAKRQVEEEERRLQEERIREAARREEEVRRAQSKRYEEDRKRQEVERLQAERRRQDVLRERSRSEAERTRRPETTRSSSYENPHPLTEQRQQESRPIPSNLVRDQEARRLAAERERQRLEAERRQQESRPIPSNLVRDQEARRLAAERERQKLEAERQQQESRPIPSNLVRDQEARRLAAERERQRLEAERRQQEEERTREDRRREIDQWRQQEIARLNSLPVSARIIILPDEDEVWSSARIPIPI